MIEARHGYPVLSQFLIYTGKILRNHLSLMDYNIQNESDMHVVQIGFKAFPTTFKVEKSEFSKAKTLTIPLRNSLLVEEAKLVIQDATGIPNECMKMFLNEQELENDSLIIETQMILKEFIKIRVISD
mmetsp:Transcript_23766/g.27331  ORF Transcript_23766/g.27331 Transcript_23766/m.27331 type:complete len:128 (-) Transcript_23766:24-407(-)